MVHYNGAGRWGHLEETRARLSPRFECVAGDVSDGPQMREFVAGCAGVIHLAALIGIPYSYHAAASYVDTNILGTLNVLEACRQRGVRRVVVTSTSEVYGSAQTTPMDESHRLNAQSPYAATKIGADQLALSYHRSHGLPVVVLRPFNTYGPRQSARALLPTILSQILSGEKTLKLGNLAPRRDLTFVTDTAEAFRAAIECPGIEGHVIHFGQGEATGVGELALRCMTILNRRIRLGADRGRARPSSSEVDLLLCDGSRARRLLGWKPRVSLDEGIRRTAAYIRHHLPAYRPREYTL